MVVKIVVPPSPAMRGISCYMSASRHTIRIKEKKKYIFISRAELNHNPFANEVKDFQNFRGREQVRADFQTV